MLAFDCKVFHFFFFFKRNKFFSENFSKKFSEVLNFKIDFLRYAPCMRKVKREYDVCSTTYQQTMARMNVQRHSPLTTSTTSAPTTTTTVSSRLKKVNLMKRQQLNSIYVSLETTTAMTIKNSSTETIDQEEAQIKTVCWWVRIELC